MKINPLKCTEDEALDAYRSFCFRFNWASAQVGLPDIAVLMMNAGKWKGDDFYDVYTEIVNSGDWAVISQEMDDAGWEGMQQLLHKWKLI
jgi:hypothetical protein